MPVMDKLKHKAVFLEKLCDQGCVKQRFGWLLYEWTETPKVTAAKNRPESTIQRWQGDVIARCCC